MTSLIISNTNSSSQHYTLSAGSSCSLDLPSTKLNIKPSVSFLCSICALGSSMSLSTLSISTLDLDKYSLELTNLCRLLLRSSKIFQNNFYISL